MILKKLFKKNTELKRATSAPVNVRRTRGTGSVFPIIKRGKERFIGRYTIGTDSKGKPIRKEFLCNSPEEASEKLKNFIKSLDTNPI